MKLYNVVYLVIHSYKRLTNGMYRMYNAVKSPV